MVFHRNIPQNQQVGNFAFGGDGTGVHVMGEQLREVDAPIEGFVGAAKGLVNGAALGAIISAALTYTGLAEGQKMTGKIVLNNIRSTHIGLFVGTTLAVSALSGFVRYARASKQNEWSQKHYDFLRSQNEVNKEAQPNTFSEREEKRMENQNEKTSSIGIQ